MPEILRLELAMEQEIRRRLLAVTGLCEAAQDYASRHLVREILDECEERIDFYEMQINVLAGVGEPNYLQSAAGDVDSG